MTRPVSSFQTTPLPADETERRIVGLVHQIRQHQLAAELHAISIESRKLELSRLLRECGDCWSDIEGYARLERPRTEVHYDAEYLDMLLLTNPTSYGWLKRCRREIISNPVQVK